MVKYSDAAISRFRSLDPNWEPPVEIQRFRFECDEFTHCRCFCTECDQIVFNIIYNCDWVFSEKHGLAHVPHDSKATCINNSCMMSIEKETHELTSTHVDKRKKIRKNKKNKSVKNTKFSSSDLTGRFTLPPKSNITYSDSF